MNKLIGCAALGAAAVVSGTMVSASTLTLDTVTLVGSNYEYSYSGTLGGDEGLVAGSKLVIVDFGDYVAGSVSSGIYASDLIASTEFTTLGLPFAPGVVDDPSIVNLVFTWTGAPFNATGGPFSDVSFAGLTAKSHNWMVAIDGFTAVTSNNNGAATGSPVYTLGTVGVAAQSPVPEPAAWALMIGGFALGGAALRRGSMAVRFA